MVQGHYLQPRCHLLVIPYFLWINIRATTAHPVIEELDEELAKDAIEPSTGGASFYWNAFEVPKYTGGL